MTTTELAKPAQNGAAILERVIVEGDLGVLTPAQRVDYYRQVCASIGLNPLTKPFDYLRLNGKVVLYAKRDAADQIRALRGVSVTITSREMRDDLIVVTARATDANGRTDESIGAVGIKGLSGESLANAYMKAETKAKRRVTLSIAGLGFLDETETSSIPDARPVRVDEATGEIIEPPRAALNPAKAPSVPAERAAMPSQAFGQDNAPDGTPLTIRGLAAAVQAKGWSADAVKATLGDTASARLKQLVKDGHTEQDALAMMWQSLCMMLDDEPTPPEPDEEA